MVRASTIRRVLTLLIAFALGRVIWRWVIADDEATSQSLVLQEGEFGADMNFHGRSCVMQGDKCIPHQEAEIHTPTKGLYTHGNKFYLDGRAIRILSGSFHYFRTQPAQWGDRLLKMKAAGLNVVTTYIPWNLHEKERGHFDFTGRYDLASFIRQVDKVGLKMIVRPGPYICAEWDWGGLPYWLLRYPDMKVRTSADKRYLEAVESYFSKLLPILAAYQYKNGGGPIIAFQVENEYGSYSQDKEYMQFLSQQYDKYSLNEFRITSDGKAGLLKGEAPGAMKTINFYKDPLKNLKGLLKVQPDKPLMVAEYWAGWFDHWGEKHHAQNLKELEKKLRFILFTYNASINFYMFVGGTNFEFWNGANYFSYYMPTITSYDYDAAISESGDTTPKYFLIKGLLLELPLPPVDVPNVPENTKKAAYGAIQMKQSLIYSDLMKLVPQNKIVTLNQTVPMELLNINSGSGQGYGYLAYTRYVEDISIVQLRGTFADRATVIYNNEKVATIDWTQPLGRVPVHSKQSRNALTILVENMGRVNFKNLNGQSKGITGVLRGDGVDLVGHWQHVPLEFDEDFNRILSKSDAWGEHHDLNVPTAYRAQLIINKEPSDTFLDMGAWGKGIVIVNGFNLGRYWERGPQQTLYVPAPLLNHGANDFIVFETDGGFGSKPPQLVFVQEPILQCSHCRNPLVVKKVKNPTRKTSKDRNVNVGGG